MKAQHYEQRIGVYVDVQNMYYSARQMYNAKTNFANILKAAVGGRRLVRAIAYVIKADIEDESRFFKALEEIGFEVRAKDLQIFVGGAKKGDWDVGIAMDMIEQAMKLDTLVLVSGDGDFVPVLQHLRRAVGCRVEVAAFGKTTSKKLVEEADSFLDLDDKRFLITGSRGTSGSAIGVRKAQAQPAQSQSPAPPPRPAQIGGDRAGERVRARDLGMSGHR